MEAALLSQRDAASSLSNQVSNNKTVIEEHDAEIKTLQSDLEQCSTAFKQDLHNLETTLEVSLLWPVEIQPKSNGCLDRSPWPDQSRTL
jgi:hypothetical protein